MYGHVKGATKIGGKLLNFCGVVPCKHDIVNVNDEKYNKMAFLKYI